jgi:hypothetical protein
MSKAKSNDKFRALFADEEPLDRAAREEAYQAALEREFREEAARNVRSACFRVTAERLQEAGADAEEYARLCTGLHIPTYDSLLALLRFLQRHPTVLITKPAELAPTGEWIAAMMLALESKHRTQTMDESGGEQQHRVAVMAANPPAAGAVEGPAPVDPCFKVVDQHRFFLIGEILKNQASSGMVTALCGLGAILCIVPFMGPDTPTRVGMSACLCLVVLLFGLVTWTGSLRMKNLLEACEIIDGGPEELAAALQNAAQNVRNEGRTAARKEGK